MVRSNKNYEQFQVPFLVPNCNFTHYQSDVKAVINSLLSFFIRMYNYNNKFKAFKLEHQYFNGKQIHS